MSGVVPEVAEAAFGLGHGLRRRGVVLEARVLPVSCRAEELRRAANSVGGKNGWYFIDGAWTVRGWIDGLLGGPGNQRSRPDRLEPDAQLDSWTIERYVEGRNLCLLSRMRLPRLARLGLHVREQGPRALLVQWVEFHPNFLTWFYWWATYPLHRLVFRQLMKGIAGHAAVIKEDIGVVQA